MKKHITIRRQRRLLPVLFILSVISLYAAKAQAAEIKGTITDQKKEPLIAAVVQIIDANGKATGQGASTDINGTYSITVKAGSYNIKTTCLGYQLQIMKAVIVKNDKPTIVNFKLNVQGKELREVEVKMYKKQLVDKQETKMEQTISTSGALYEYDMAAAPAAGVQASGYTKYKLARAEEAYDMAEIPKPYPTPDEKPDPMTNETYKKITDNPFLSAMGAPLSTFSIDVDVASYGIMRKKITDGILPPVDAVRIEEMVNYFPYNYDGPTDDKPFAVRTEFTDCPWDASHKLLRIGIQGKRIEEEKLPPSNLVFLVDVSGSMMSPERLPLIQRSLDMLVDKMRKQDHIALVAYAGNAGLVLPSTSGAEKDKIKHAIDNLEGGGSTAGGAGIELAYKVAVDNFIKGGNNRVMLCTDGDFNVGVSSEADLTALIEQKRKTGVFLSLLGVGTGNYKDREMEQLADKGNGNYAYIDNEKEARKNLVTQMGGTLHTIAKDVKIQAVFNPACVKSYRLIGYENRRLENKDFSNDKIDAGEIGAGTAVTALYEVVLGPDRKESTVALDDKKKHNDEMTLAASDLMALRIRYKAPDGDKSSLIESHVSVDASPLASASEDFRFAAAVASFGMLLRDSPYKGNYTFDKVKALASASVGKDDEGYRHEFLSLIDQAHNLSPKTASK